jgi:hypothetical protein
MNLASNSSGAGNAEEPRGQDARRSSVWMAASWGERDGVTTDTFTGREAQMLALLLDVGDDGLTSGEAPGGWARRTSSYIHKLRQAGLQIETQMETLPCGTRIGRYVLLTRVRVHAREGC